MSKQKFILKFTTFSKANRQIKKKIVKKPNGLVKMSTTMSRSGIILCVWGWVDVSMCGIIDLNVSLGIKK